MNVILTELRERREALWNQTKSMLDSADTEHRDLTPAESSEYQANSANLTSMRQRIQQLEEQERSQAAASAALTRALGSPGQSDTSSDTAVWLRADTGKPAVVEKRQKFAEHDVVTRSRSQHEGADAAVIGQHGSLGAMLRAMSTTGGSALVPTAWSGDLIDLARNKAAVMQAGAQLVPMEAKTVQIARLTGDPTAAFRAENSPITASDPAFDNVTLTAKTLSALVVGSLEWFQDAENADAIVTEAISAAIASTIDLHALYGGVIAGAGTINLPTPPGPRGVLAALQAVATANVLGGATNGTAQTTTKFWDEVLDTIFTVRDANEEPNALVWSSKLARQYAKAVDTTGQPLRLPSDVEELQRYSSNQIPQYTLGTMASRATDLFVGDWTKLLVGQRLGLTIQVLTERYAENGQVGIVAHWRGDIQVARPKSFAVYRGLQGAA